MFEDKPACPVHGVRFVKRSHGGGVTAQYGTWFACGLCNFKRYVPSNPNVVLAATAVTVWVFALAVKFLH